MAPSPAWCAVLLGLSICATLAAGACFQFADDLSLCQYASCRCTMKDACVQGDHATDNERYRSAGGTCAGVCRQTRTGECPGTSGYYFSLSYPGLGTRLTCTAAVPPALLFSQAMPPASPMLARVSRHRHVCQHRHTSSMCSRCAPKDFPVIRVRWCTCRRRLTPPQRLFNSWSTSMGFTIAYNSAFCRL
jgi:hypothetical protein